MNNYRALLVESFCFLFQRETAPSGPSEKDLLPLYMNLLKGGYTQRKESASCCEANSFHQEQPPSRKLQFYGPANTVTVMSSQSVNSLHAG